MGFGNFASNLGYSGTGVNQADAERNNLQEQNMRIKNTAIATRKNQNDEADNNNLLRLQRAQQEAQANAVAPTAAPASSPSGFTYQNPNAPAVQAPVTAGAPAQSAMSAPVQPATGAPNVNTTNPYPAKISAEQAKLTALRSASGYQSNRDNRALVQGTVGPLTAAADVITMPVNGAGMLVEKGVNAVNRVGNAITGSPTFNDKNSYFSDHGTTPYYDRYMRQTGRDNLNTPEEQKILDNIDEYTKANTAQASKLGKLKNANSLSSLKSDLSGAPITQITPEFAAAFVRRVSQQESSNNPNAVNQKTGAIGLTQITPVLANDLQQHGFKVDLTTPEGQLEATHNGLNLIANYLSANGKPVTLNTLTAAWFGGAGAVNKDGSFKNRSDGNLNIQQYVDKANNGSPQTAGLAPQSQAPQGQAGQAQTEQPFNVADGTKFSMGTQGGPRNPDDDQLDMMDKQAHMIMQTTHSSQAFAQAQMVLQQNKVARFESEVTKMGSAASSGDMDAMHNLLGVYSQATGTNYGVAQAPDGQFVLANGNKIIGHGSPADITRHLHEVASPALAKRIQDSYYTAQAKAAETEAVEGTKAKYEQSLQQMKDNSSLNVAKQNGNNSIAVAKVNAKARLDALIIKTKASGGSITKAFAAPDNSLIYVQDGKLFQAAPPYTDKYGVHNPIPRQVSQGEGGLSADYVAQLEPMSIDAVTSGEL